ncbi:hypothetical protein BKA67DRAFT_565672 [Truncatella angustata]|uniref:Uncharacterized protein n=1 Tax=Truncatella angustata TaxID=152316 RepID=A0A9P8UMA3_9PEZI|nr:uncharacterized protein BKA67DRAFT_565672 [Truncatella angustata]KAH6654592.1 hypothetical protein BKA67DRAFT_565672 [Truncatella angustata]
MSNPNTELELSCLSEGKFYVRDIAKVRFIGCSTVDPFADGSGYCPQLDLRPSSFSSGHCNEIRKQRCDDSDDDKNWYTCQASPPFLEYCRSIPCQSITCQTEDIIPARLSHDQTAAQALIGITSTASTPTSNPLQSSNKNTGAHLSTVAIIRIAVSGAVVVLILIGVLAY